jgi:hypothetical protein
MKRKQGQRHHSYLITFLVALKQRFWARREASLQCKKQCLRHCLDPIILVVFGRVSDPGREGVWMLLVSSKRPDQANFSALYSTFYL